MRSLYTITSDRTKRREILGKSEKLSVYYHDLFDFPLTFADLIKWEPSEHLLLKQRNVPVVYQNGYYFLDKRKGLVYKRSLRSRISAKKLEIAEKASGVLSLIPAVLMVAVTGSLAMGNAGDESDVDLFIITGRNLLWTTRILSYLVLKVFGFDLRRPGGGNQKDKLCLNMWMDETDLAWRRSDRNLYTAHEIAQILPLVNKNNAYEKFLYKNKWILKYWPNAVKLQDTKILRYKDTRKKNLVSSIEYLVSRPIEKLAFWFQYQHMRSKISREVVTKSRAIFHPQDLGKLVISRLGS